MGGQLKLSAPSILAEGDRAGKVITWAVGRRSLPTEELALGWACPGLLGVSVARAEGSAERPGGAGGAAVVVDSVTVGAACDPGQDSCPGFLLKVLLIIF